MEDVWPLARHHRPEADDQGASRETSEVVLKENPGSIVENQRLRKQKERVVLDSSIRIPQAKYSPAAVTFSAGQACA
jgi:hypothetical protein